MSLENTLREEIFANEGLENCVFRGRIKGIRLISRMKDFLEFFRDKSISEYRLILIVQKKFAKISYLKVDNKFAAFPIDCGNQENIFDD